MIPATMRVAILITLWLAALMASVLIDVPVAEHMRDSGWEAWIERNRDVREFLKLPGEFGVVIGVAIVAGLVHRGRWQASAFVLAATIASGLNGLTKWVVGRHRPYTWLHEQSDRLRAFEFTPFRDGWEGLLVSRNLSFPSGHAALAFALATALAMLWPRGRWAFYAIASVTAFERVWENAHYVSEAVAAAGLGVGVVSIMSIATVRALPATREWLMTGETTQDRRTEPVTGHGTVRVDLTAPAGESRPFLSLVIPAYNEQENIPTLLTRVEAALTQTAKPFEVLIVDDGSTDQTPQLLAEAMTRLPWLRVLRMARNAGQSAAFEAGFSAARGEVIATIDADLQNDPEEIPRLLPLLDEHQVDMITGWRKERQDTPFRRWQSRQANRIRNWISQETVNDSASSLKLYRAHAIQGLRLFNGAHRFFPTLVKMRGYTCYETPVKHSQRFAGTAKYGFRNRAVRAFVDLLAVRWMKTRYLRYQANEVERSAAR
jgi:membrane-associated phospholipid phosphatase